MRGWVVLSGLLIATCGCDAWKLSSCKVDKICPCLYTKKCSKRREVDIDVRIDNSGIVRDVQRFKEVWTTNVNASSLRHACVLVSLVSAPLGTLLDNYHGLFGVLSYNSNALPYQLMSPMTDGSPVLKSAAFVPFLFSFAGLVMSFLQVTLDVLFQTPVQKRSPTWSQTFSAIGFFSLQYYLSGLLDFYEFSRVVINIFLTIYAFLGWRFFDNTRAGFALGLLTAIAGPSAELILINVPHLYVYTHADFLGICTWIPAVYFFGAPAVGSLTRSIYNHHNGYE